MIAGSLTELLEIREGRRCQAVVFQGRLTRSD